MSEETAEAVEGHGGRGRLLWRLGILVLILLIIGGSALYWRLRGDPDALWTIISEQCIPSVKARHDPSPCLQVDEKEGFVVYKDRNGPEHDLLLPTAKISGIESDVLLQSDTPNYFMLAWAARHFLSDGRTTPIGDENVSLAVNSSIGRTQNQLHIHISCLRPEVKSKLLEVQGNIGAAWQPVAGGLRGRKYWVRRVYPNDLNDKGAFRLLANGLPGAAADMGDYGLGMSILPDGDFLLVATKMNLLRLNLASAEELQDHSCKIAEPGAAAQ